MNQTSSTVFVVDDDQAMRNSLKWLISSVGMKVESFDSANAFLDGYAPGRPGCLLLDVRMPGMSGLDLQELLVKRDIRLPVIIAYFGWIYVLVLTLLTIMGSLAVGYLTEIFVNDPHS